MSHTRIVVFLGEYEALRPARYHLAGRNLRQERPDKLPHGIWFQLAGLAPPVADPACGASLVVIGSDFTWDNWLAARRLQEHVRYSAGGATVPLVFVGYDEMEAPAAADDTDPFWAVFESLRRVLDPREIQGTAHRGIQYPGAGVHVIDPRGATTLPAADRILVDITHGFRSLPFIGASALNFSLGEQRRRRRQDPSTPRPPEYQILYAAERMGQSTDGSGIVDVPLWDLTRIEQATALSSGVDAFLSHGHADLLADVLERCRTRSCQTVAPDTRAFANDLALLRVPGLLARSIPDLLSSFEAAWADLVRELPPIEGDLRLFLDRLREITTQRVDTISVQGVAASVPLARLLLSFGNYAGVWGLLREELVNIWTVSTETSWKQPGEEGFKKLRTGKHSLEERMRETADQSADNEDHQTERRSAGEDAAVLGRHLFDHRNDVLHCGHREQIVDEAGLRQHLQVYLDRFTRIVARLTSQ